MNTISSDIARQRLVPDTNSVADDNRILLDRSFDRKYAACLDEGMDSSDALATARQYVAEYERNLLS